jgi:hypothetical protein
VRQGNNRRVMLVAGDREKGYGETLDSIERFRQGLDR